MQNEYLTWLPMLLWCVKIRPESVSVSVSVSIGGWLQKEKPFPGGEWLRKTFCNHPLTETDTETDTDSRRFRNQLLCLLPFSEKT